MEKFRAKLVRNWRIYTLKQYSKFPSLKLNKIVLCQSLLERDYVYLLERDISVIRYKEQPCKIYYTVEGNRHRYTPDFLVERKNKKQIVEVKPARQVAKENFQALFRIIAQICLQEGYEFVVVTDTMIRAQPRLGNIKMMYRYAKVPLYPQHQIFAKELLGAELDTCINSLALFLKKKGCEDAVSVVYAMCYRGMLKSAPTESIGPDTVITLPDPV